jgi:hypothetical protein
VFSSTADGKTAITVEYVARYADDSFTGEVNWSAVMPIDSMTLRSRLPLSLAKQDTASHAVLATFEYVMPEEGGGGASGEPRDRGDLAGRRLSVATQRNGRSGNETIVVPSPVNGLASGWTILSLF